MTKPYEDILGEVLEGGSRAESRAARGLPADGPNPWAEFLEEAEVLDAELVDDASERYIPPPPDEPSFADGPGPYSQAAPSSGLMPLEDALAILGDERRQAAAGSARISPRRHR
ncbi:hypothetical protein ACFVAV_01490 [Nocardia sp. NPDC057663]|uniref:hypothetical protein n=1 Tax=Nocardia sp. NPDC057663 TaxID=3346201 RepID=UPI003670A815